MSIGSNIYALRKAKKVTQAQLAEKIGVSEQAVSKWENDVCAPDVSLFPVIAEYFGVSIDRLFGYHNNSYAEEVKKIIQAADDSMDTYKEIEIISEGLSRYPNSPELKIYLAFSLSMVNRISEDADERAKAVEKAIKVCTEVVDTCGDQEQVDDALHMLTRIYNETAQYEKAQACIEKMSAECYDRRVLGMVGMMGGKKSYAEQEQYAQYALWKMYWTMSHVLEKMLYNYSRREPNSHGFERQISAPAADKMLAISYIASHFLFASAKYLLAQNCAAPSGVEFFDGFCQSESKQDTHLARRDLA